MRTTLALSVACFAGCGGDPKPPPGVDADLGPQWWQPKVGEAKNWDIQLNAPIDVSAPRLMYDLDLWDLVPSQTMIDYGDGDPVIVEAGKLAGTIAQLHARTPPTIVICHVETGALELSRPDARKFPGYNKDSTKIPNNPAPPAVGSVIGWHVLDGTKRWLDIREASRAKVVPIMFKRFDLAKQIGCDGVEPERNEVFQFNSGFSPDGYASYSWYAEIAKQGHARMLSTGMKNGHTLPDQPDMEADKFDWLMIERCGEEMNCDLSRPFINLHKAVFAIDYDHVAQCPDPPPPAGCPPLPPQSSTVVCPQQALAMIADGIVKDAEVDFKPTSKVRIQCVP